MNMPREHSHEATGEAGIAHGLRDLGVEPGDVLLVHGSLKSFGLVSGGADAVIDGLLAAVGPTGTIMAPTITGKRDDSPEHPPVFDARATPCWTGAIPEALRRRMSARRSLHPTHSVAAIGPHTDYLIRDHPDCDTPCGPGSPYLRLAELDGKVVFLGVTLDSCTLMHSVEELAGCAYHMQPNPVIATVIDDNGLVSRRGIRIHDWGTRRRFHAMEPIFVENGILRLGKIGQAEVRVLRAKPAVEITLEILRKSPRFLCEHE
jgi:aminoglycoside 3-N-acetyltransferase